MSDNKLEEFKRTKPLVGCMWLIVVCLICAFLLTIYIYAS